MKIEKLSLDIRGRLIEEVIRDLIAQTNIVIDHLNALEEKKPEEEWPTIGSVGFIIEGDGAVIQNNYTYGTYDAKRKAFGNFFRSRVEAEAARDKIRELLKNL